MGPETSLLQLVKETNSSKILQPIATDTSDTKNRQVLLLTRSNVDVTFVCAGVGLLSFVNDKAIAVSGSSIDSQP